jgi:hypothetical protein
LNIEEGRGEMIYMILVVDVENNLKFQLPVF